ncbi:MAG: hypothetical protein JWQ40_2608 [Segetibacter sp.]|jgi:hypothetical protein|nr:hypothetical protein [Segetibacter sp.]
MIQREVTDKENVKWTCVQAYSGLQEKLSDKAAALSENKEGKFTVVCTPSGGAQTVRLELPENWTQQMQDEEIVNAIAENQR